MFHCAHFLTLFSSLLFSVTAYAQMQKPPSDLLSADTLVLLDIPDGQSFLKKAKAHYYDVFYRDLIQSRGLRSLDLPATQYTSLQSNGGQHWLAQSLANLRTVDDAWATRFRDEIDYFQSIQYEIAPDEEDLIVAMLAETIPGRVFFAVEASHGHARCLFGVEYSPDVFDWGHEMKAASQAQTGAGTPFDTIDGIDIYFLPQEEIFFFTHDNVLYGVSDDQVDRCIELAQQVIRHDLPDKALSESRFFRRCASPLGYSDESFDLFCYVHASDLFALDVRHFLDPQTNRREQGIALSPTPDMLGWGEMFGGTVYLGEEANRVRFRTVFPQTLPRHDVVRSVLDNSLADLDPSQARTLLPVSHANYMMFNTLADFPRYPLGHSGRRYLGGEFSREFWHSVASPIAADKKKRLGFQETLLTSFDRPPEGPIEICRVSKWLSNSEKTFNHSVCYGTALRKADLSLASVNGMRDQISELLDSDAFAAQRTQVERSFATAKQFWRQRQDSERDSTSEKADRKPSGLEWNSALDSGTGHREQHVEVLKVGVGNAALVDFGDTLAILSTLPPSVAQSISESTVQSFVVDDWFENRLMKAGQVKLLAIARGQGQVYSDQAFYPLKKFFSRCEGAGRWNAGYRTHLIHDRAPIDGRQLSFLFKLSRVISAGFAYTPKEFRWERDLPFLQVYALVSTKDRVEFHGLIRDDK